MARKNIGRTVTGPAGESFLLTDSLGLGAFGEVYRAVGQASGLVVAVKLLSESQFDGPVAEQSLVNEAKLAQEVDHPNVVKVLHSAIDTALGPFLMMEYVPDGTLKGLLHAQAGQPLDLGRVIDIAIQIAQGVRAINQGHDWGQILTCKYCRRSPSLAPSCSIGEEHTPRSKRGAQASS